MSGLVSGLQSRRLGERGDVQDGCGMRSKVKVGGNVGRGWEKWGKELVEMWEKLVKNGAKLL